MLATAGAYVEPLTENAMKFDHAPYVALAVKVDISDYVPEAFGTCDCLMIGGDELIITDYKHGAFAPDFDTAANVLIAAGYAKSALYREQPETLTKLFYSRFSPPKNGLSRAANRVPAFSASSGSYISFHSCIGACTIEKLKKLCPRFLTNCKIIRKKAVLNNSVP